MSFRIDRRDFLVASSTTAGLAAITPNSLCANARARVRVVRLKVDHLDRPLGLENPYPRLSWRMESEARNVRQSAYRILVASSESVLKERRGDLWDSGKVASKECLSIEYRGRVLASRQRCFWCVQVWDEAANASDWSETGGWEMGLLEPQDWTAHWLAAEDTLARADREAGLHWIRGATSADAISRKLRFTFELPVATCGGTLFAVGKQWSNEVMSIWIDGKRVSNDGDYKNLSGRPHEVWPLAAGRHLVAVEIRRGNGPEAASAIAIFARLSLANGEVVRLTSRSGWKTSLATQPRWFAPEQDDSTWEAAQALTKDSEQPWPATPAMHLRRGFLVEGAVVQARLYVTALGAYEARLNGRRVGDALLAPEISQYRKQVLYRVYDATAAVHEGANVLGLTVGDGWYASFEGRYAWGPPPRRVLAQLELTMADGSRQIVATGPGWRISESPIRTAEIRTGEIYDARLEQSGWDFPGFDDVHWQDAEMVDTPPCRLVAQVSPPIRATQILKPLAISQPTPGAYVFDFGQNFAGWCRLRVKGPEGTRIELQFAENLAPSGEIDSSSYSVQSGEVQPRRDVFILRGDAAGEVLEPHFTYQGFRYAQVIGLPQTPCEDCIEGVVIHSDLEVTGTLRIGNSLIEQIWKNTVWTQRSNFVGIPTDCPGREQRGWMGDAGVFWDAAAFNMDVGAFTWRQVANAIDDQAPSGALPMLAPEPWEPSASAPAWGDGGIILPWTVFRRYGDHAILEQNWQAMSRYLEFIADNNPDFIWRHQRGLDFGDWLAIGENSVVDRRQAPTTPKDLIGTAYWAHSADLLSQMAEAIGRTEETTRLRALHDRIRQAFNAVFVRPDGTVGNGSQTSYILALKFNLLPEQLRPMAAERLVADIRQRGIALSTGILGTQFSLDVLTDAGYAELAYSLLLRTEYPSWGYMIRNGATTVWENWLGEREFVSHRAKLSQNHYALGAICGFLFRRIAGIDATEPGFTQIIIRPVLDPRVKRGGGDYDSVMGRISTDWVQQAGGRFTLEASIPANCSACIYLPAPMGARVWEGRRDVAAHPQVRLVDRSDNTAVVKTGSGRYRFFVDRS